MTESPVVPHDEWLAARKEFLVKEKELTRARDALNAQRRALPRKSIDKNYLFDGPDGKASLLDLFEGRRQLLTYHFMWPLEGLGWCPICSFWIDNVGHLSHFHARDTTFVIVCSAPQDLVQPFKKRMGWTIPWYSTDGDEFRDDFTLDADTEFAEWPGVSAFIREGDRIQYSYSTYSRGSEMLNGTYHYLDLTPLGRQEDHLEDKMGWIRHHDEYGTGSAHHH